MPTGTVYSPAEVYDVVDAVYRQRTGYQNPSIGVLRATYVILRESGGNAAAYRPASENPDGGNDRGWWQFNDKWFPDVTDMVAFDPLLATQKAFDVSKGFTDFRPWSTSRDPDWGLSGSKHQTDAFNAALTAFLGGKDGVTLTTAHNQYKGPFTDADGPQSIRNYYRQFVVSGFEQGRAGWGIPGPIDDWLDDGFQFAEVVGGNFGELTEGALASVTPDWMEALAKFLGNLLDPTWWKRVGIGVIALLIIIIALVLVFRRSVMNAAMGGNGNV